MSADARTATTPGDTVAVLRARIGLLSVCGARDENRDAVGARLPTGAALSRRGMAFAVADGVSHAEAGRLAAETSVQNFLSDYYATPDAWEIKRAGAQVLNALNRWLLGQGLSVRDEHRGCATTFTGCVLQGRQLHFFHIGDTRLYRLRRSVFERLTRDHRVLIDDNRPVLTRALGLDLKLDIDYAVYPAEPGDAYLLLSDGVHDFLDDNALATAIAAQDDPETVCRTLIDNAIQHHSDDNLSAVLVRVDTLPASTVDDVIADWDVLPLLPVLSVGHVIDGLRVERILAESPRSQTYRVRDIASGAERILKAPSPLSADLPRIRREYATEAWVLRRVQHPRLPRTAEPPLPRSALYVLLDPVPGITLATWMREHRPAPVPEAIQIVRQVAGGLRALHRRDILHRDIRPANVLLDGNGQATLIDLGCCRVAALHGSNGLADDGPGAREYAAPEYGSVSPVGERADQFSLAALCYEMLTGHLPFAGKLAEAHATGRYQKLVYENAAHHNPLVPPWLDAVLARALSLDAQKRFGDIAEFADALAVPTHAISAHVPLMARNPLRAWQTIAALLALSQLIMIGVLLAR